MSTAVLPGLAPVAPARKPFATQVASDGLRIGLTVPFYPQARDLMRGWGGAWNGARMWVFSNQDFRDRVLAHLPDVLQRSPTFEAEGLRDRALAAWRNADPERFVAHLEAQLIPLEAGGHVFQSAFDPLTTQALRILRAVWHRPASAWAVDAPLERLYETLTRVAGIPAHLVYLHDQKVTLEDLSSPSESDFALTVSGAPPESASGRGVGETGSSFVTATGSAVTALPIDEARLREVVRTFGLYDFQEEGVRHLLGASSALLADDMGLGKSRQAVTAAHLAASAGKILIVCPASLRINWQREVNTVLPDAVVALVGEASIEHLAAARWHVCTFERLGRLVRERVLYQVMVIDEAHYLKEHDVNRTRNALMLSQRIERRFLLTGTPVLNRESELHTLLRLSGHPIGLLPLSEFHSSYCGSPAARQRLGEQVATWMLRRKKDVLKNLPDKLHEVRYIEPACGREEYKRILRDPILGSLPKITALRQCLETLKIDYVLELVRGLADDDKLLVFCEYVGSVEALRVALKEEGVGCVSITGSDTSFKRQQAVDRFQNDPAVRVFIGTSGAAGVGITLTAANHVVFAGLPWTPALKRQAEDRAYRNGQKRRVLVIVPLIPGTLDEELYRLLEAKTGVENELIDAAGDERAMQQALMARLGVGQTRCAS